VRSEPRAPARAGGLIQSRISPYRRLDASQLPAPEATHLPSGLKASTGALAEPCGREVPSMAPVSQTLKVGRRLLSLPTAEFTGHPEADPRQGTLSSWNLTQRYVHRGG